ncbi:MAG: AsmA family protein [Terriglobia bacterium]
MRKWLIVCCVLAVLAVIVIAALRPYLSSYVRQRAVETLGERYDSQVSFKTFQVSVLPDIKIVGEGMAVRREGRTDVPPLIHVQKFSAETGLLELLRRPHHVRSVRLQGLKIAIPPPAERITSQHHPPHKRFPVVVDEIDADNSELDMLPKGPGKPSRIFVIHHLVIHGAGQGRAMPFTATLTNPVPKGEIQTRGAFGPWQTDEPGLTPLNAAYTFTHANLATIRGIAGMLSSKGKFGGVLSRIDVVGTTSTPDFRLSVSGNPVPLETNFHAIVDGTTGNTLLNPVRAQIYRSSFEVRGGVFKVTGSAHREVILDMRASKNRLEDLLPLALKRGESPMKGQISYAARLKIPAGKGDFVDRMKLSGSFAIGKASFTKLNVQGKVDRLSRKGLGLRQAGVQSIVASRFHGRFDLGGGVMRFSKLTFSVPGASVRLAGAYNLHSEQLDFHGSLRLRAELSQLTTGWKSVLLKPLDPLFHKKGAGTVLPIKVTGTESDPSFGIDVGRVF